MLTDTLSRVYALAPHCEIALTPIRGRSTAALLVRAPAAGDLSALVPLCLHARVQDATGTTIYRDGETTRRAATSDGSGAYLSGLIQL